MARPIATAARGGWIGGPLFDLGFFFGGSLLAVAAGILALARPATVLPLWLLWLWLVEGPHLVATWQRTYLDAACRRRQWRLLAASLLWMLPAPLVLLVSLQAGQPQWFMLLLGGAALWSYHHAVRQHHGILAIYQRLHGASSRTRRIDSALLHATLWAAFILFLLVQPANRELLGMAPVPGPHARLIISALAGALLLASALWALMLALRWRQGRALTPGLFALVAVLGCNLFAFFVVGMREPLLAGALTTEQVFMAATVVGGILHGLQYLGIVIATSRRRALADGAAATIGSRLGRHPLRAYAVMLLLALAYLWLTALRGAIPPGAPLQTLPEQWFLALYWGLFFHHYWLDQKIWKPSSDPRLRAELGMAGP